MRLYIAGSTLSGNQKQCKTMKIHCTRTVFQKIENCEIRSRFSKLRLGSKTWFCLDALYLARLSELCFLQTISLSISRQIKPSSQLQEDLITLTVDRKTLNIDEEMQEMNTGIL